MKKITEAIVFIPLMLFFSFLGWGTIYGLGGGICELLKINVEGGWGWICPPIWTAGYLYGACSETGEWTANMLNRTGSE